jgi:tetratricopeptide (TPR) repeat protein
MSNAAIEEYKKALNVILWYQTDDVLFIHENLAKIYMEKKLYNEALEEYKILAELDPIFAKDYDKLKSSIESK